MIEIKNIEIWSKRNRMDLNMEKTYEMVIRRNILTPLKNVHTTRLQVLRYACQTVKSLIQQSNNVVIYLWN